MQMQMFRARNCNISNFIYPQMLAPIIGGLLFDFVGYSFAALFIAAWNSISGIVEYTLLILIYRWVCQTLMYRIFISIT